MYCKSWPDRTRHYLAKEPDCITSGSSESGPLEEKDYRKYLLADYTFLKRPVVVCGNQIFIGQEKKNLDALKACLLNISGT